jgi:FlaG/FlaF family flagellin (archaellin)
MKGVSEIITLVLIALIVVAMAGMAYMWFSGMLTTLTGDAQEKVDQSTNIMASNFRIEFANKVTDTVATVTILNLGSAPINVSKMSAYVNGERYQIDYQHATLGYLKYGNISTFNVTGLSDPAGKRLRLVVESGVDQTTTIS